MPRVTISEPDKTPQPYRFKLEREIINIGRGSDNDIIIECGSVSTQHSVMKRIEGGYILRDNGSTNGIKQDDTPMDTIDLYDGMEVIVGDIPLKFELSEEEIDTLSKEEFVPQQKKKLPALAKEPKEDPELPDEKPPASPSRPSSLRPPQPLASAKPGMSPFLALLLMAAAVFGGMVIRHYKDHDKFLLSKQVEKQAENKSDEAPENDTEDEDTVK